MTAKPTAHEMMSLNELIRMESITVQQVQAMMPMIADPEMRELMSVCQQTGKNHVKAMVQFVQSTQGAH